MRKLLTLALIIFVFRGNNLAQQWQSFTTENSGLPSNNIFSVAADSFGIIWFGSDAGVTGYDGSNWQTYTRADCLADLQVNDLKIMEQTELWLATNNGVSALGFSSLDAITMATPYRTNNTGLLSNKINSLAIDQNLVRWFATDSGVTAFTGQHWISTNSPHVVLENDVLAVDVGPDLIAYCGTEGGGVARLKLSGIDIVTGASTIERPWAPVPIDSVLAIHIDADGLQWFGTTQGLFQHQGINSKINWKRFTVSDGLPHPAVQAIAEDATGQIWVGTRHGVTCTRKDLSSFKNFFTANGLIHDDVRDIAVASDGSIWFATAGGVSKLAPNSSPVSLHAGVGRPAFFELDIYPNPFNSSTTIEFKLDHPGPTQISIYNLAGKHVRTLWSGPANGDRQVVHWTAQDDHGLPVPSGLYFVRCWNGALVMHKKMLFIK